MKKKIFYFNILLNSFFTPLSLISCNNQVGDKKIENNNLNNKNNSDSDNVNTSENKLETNDFKSLENFDTKLEVVDFYKDHDALSFYEKIKNNQNTLIGFIKIKPSIWEEFEIQASFDDDFNNIDNKNGLIKNIKLVFVKNNKNKVFKITLSGFLVKDKENIDERDNLLIQKNIKESNISKLFPSFVASMLVFNSNSSLFTDLQNRSQDENETIINYDNLINREFLEELFRPNSGINLTPLILRNFFFERTDKELSDDELKFNYKISGAKANDLEGTLSIEVSIFRLSDQEKGINDEKRKVFNFSGFKKFKRDENQKILPTIIDFYMLLIEKKEAIKKIRIKDVLESEINKLASNEEKFEVTDKIIREKINILKNAIFNKLLVNIFSGENDEVYNWIDNDTRISKLIGRKDKQSIYPFVTTLSSNLIKNIRFYISKKDNSDENELIVDVDFSFLPYVSSTISDFTSSHSSAEEIEWTKEFIRVKINDL
ncbi:LppA-related lipoprotein [Mesomycoplasma molare]|uniref:Lipoprotein n=1 Tax=Mesomycoplasma molare TaxID=171288 RepID=A0ABY5TTM9_9BACT|nr:hypothetical protein [Mesomycoplasma molare]UWD34022.1 hypothetical protein NX772_02865 [Mesomycoplasma molare]